jgi:hypothetical protein
MILAVEEFQTADPGEKGDFHIFWLCSKST